MFLSEAGVRMDSRVRAINHLRERNLLTEQLHASFDDLGKKSRPEKKSETPLQRPQVNVEENLIDETFALDETLPESWKSKPDKANPSKKSVMSPDGRKFESKVKAYKYLCEQSECEDLNKVKLSMKKSLINHDGFKESKALPHGWIYKEDFMKQINFITDKGMRFASIESTRSHLLKAKDQESIKIFEEFLSQFNRSKSSNDVWIDNDETVPKGWLTKTVPNKDSGSVRHPEKRLFQLPDGREFTSRTSALHHLVSVQVQAEEETVEVMMMIMIMLMMMMIQELRGFLHHEGWQVHEHLPR